jgi:hypothetical protein
VASAILAMMAASRRHAGDHALQGGAGQRHLLRLGGIEGHADAATRLGRNQPLALQPAQRFLQGCGADTELCRHLPLFENCPRRKLTGDDGAAKHVMDMLTQPFQIGGVDRLEPWRRAALHEDSAGPNSFWNVRHKAL